MKRFVSVLLLSSGLVVAGGTNAAVTVSIQQSGSNVVVTTSGSLNTAALGPPMLVPGFTVGGTWPDIGYVLTGDNVAGDFFVSLPNSAVSPSYGSNYWGSGGNTAPSLSAGSLFSIEFDTPAVQLPVGYTTGTSLAGTATFSGQTLAGLGITNLGTYTLTFGVTPNTDSVTVVISIAPAAVPSLSELAQLMLGLMVIGIAWHFHNNRQNSY